MNEPASIQRLLEQQLAIYAGSHKLDSHRLKVCRHLVTCHTPALGGIQYQCDHCHDEVPQYHSCRDRHCPQCQQRASRRWSEQQQHAILPVTYHHLVVTLPHALNGWVQLHPEEIYPMLFRVVWHTLKAFAADPKRLGGKLGMTAVLHTWGQNLSQHVHLHCLIPGGALTEHNEWHRARSSYLFPVRALSRHIRGSMVSALREAATAGKLNRVTRAEDIDNMLNRLMQQDWVVYSKDCLNHTHSIVGYLARYSHRIAISDQRILSQDEETISFSYKDYRDREKQKVMTLEHAEFIRRFLLHVLPKGLMRIRHYGLLANRCRKRSLETIRTILAQAEPAEEHNTDGELRMQTCPKCHKGNLIAIRLLNPVWRPVSLAPT
jgi:hypothetical protein